MQIPFDQSPNYTYGRSSVKYIIIHSMAGSFEGTRNLV